MSISDDHSKIAVGIDLENDENIVFFIGKIG